MPPQSQPRSYGSTFERDFGPPPPGDAPPSSQSPHRPRKKNSTTRIPRRSRGGPSGAAIALFMLVILAGGGFFGYAYVEGLKAEVKEAKAELVLASAKISDAQKLTSVANAAAASSQEKVAETEASLEAAQQAAAEKEEAAAAIQTKLQSLLKDGQGEVTMGKDGRLTLQLVDKVLFRSGEALLTKRGQRVMGRVGKALKEMDDKQVWVQGHTDNVPVREDNKLFQSNWELSAARALTVVHYLQEVSEVDPKRLAAAAFGSHRPVSRRKKAKNRRIEIVLFPQEVKLKR